MLHGGLGVGEGAGVRIVAFDAIKSACRGEELKLCESQRDVRKRVWRGMRVGTRMAYMDGLR